MNASIFELMVGIMLFAVAVAFIVVLVLIGLGVRFVPQLMCGM